MARGASKIPRLGRRSLVGGRRVVSGSVWSSVVAVAVLVPLQGLGSDVRVVTYVALTVWAFLGVRQSVQALSLCWLLLFLNPEMFPPTAHEAGLRWLVVASAAFRVYLAVLTERPSGLTRESLWLLGFTVVIAGTAIVVSRSPIVSVLKAFALLATVFAILEGFRIRGETAGYWRAWFEGFFAVVVVGSFLLIGNDLGYVRNQRGFQGILNHPQAYGVFLAPVFAWFAGGLLERLYGWNRPSPSLWRIAMVAVCGVSLVATESRTAAIAVVLGGVLAYILRAPSLASRRRAAVALVFVTLVVSIALALSPVGEAAVGFLRKWDREAHGDVIQGMIVTRSALIAQSWANFQREPWFGIGFGLESVPGTWQETAEMAGLGLPIAAPTEKGFLPTALLEETGIVGTTLFAAFVVGLLTRIARRCAFSAVWMAMTAILVNIGESLLTSPGGMGLFVWLMLGYARTQVKGSDMVLVRHGAAGHGRQLGGL